MLAFSPSWRYSSFEDWSRVCGILCNLLCDMFVIGVLRAAVSFADIAAHYSEIKSNVTTLFKHGGSSFVTMAPLRH